MTTVFFDLETGGLEDHHPDIVLAALAVDAQGQELSSFYRRILFSIDACEQEALRLNCYNAEAWVDAKQEAQVVNEFSAWLRPHRVIEQKGARTGNTYLVARLAGHNAASFDGPRLRRMFARHDAFLPAAMLVLDTLQLALWWHHARGKTVENFKLGTLCAQFSIPLITPHDALADVRATAQLAMLFTGENHGTI
jgi:DNA polymerase III epsilon subunit-like protein